MTIQLNIYIVKWLDNCVYSNDYTIDHIHSQMTIQFIYISNDTVYDYTIVTITIDHIHSQMTIQLTIYIVKWL